LWQPPLFLIFISVKLDYYDSLTTPPLNYHPILPKAFGLLFASASNGLYGGIPQQMDLKNTLDCSKPIANGNGIGPLN